MRISLCAALAAAAVALGVQTPAHAEDCTTLQTVSQDLRRESPDVQMHLVTGTAASRLSAGISALIGETVPEGGSFLVVDLPGRPISYVVRFVDGCATHHGRFPNQLLRTWIDGSPA